MATRTYTITLVVESDNEEDMRAFGDAIESALDYGSIQDAIMDAGGENCVAKITSATSDA